jgi:hypothetical protein
MSVAWVERRNIYGRCFSIAPLILHLRSRLSTSSGLLVPKQMDSAAWKPVKDLKHGFGVTSSAIAFTRSNICYVDNVGHNTLLQMQFSHSGYMFRQ